ncbi:hypothetical protein EVAR_93484_1 [Eumeta japonica]|uniref:Uncharacterized protein n=1 Tax=Eumeta variegata TaxID=151549 RepID=A0A4C1TMM6_EUMVA|nr:hypothetical protein EVAR_93484_1 [Eumeta japonica]
MFLQGQERHVKRRDLPSCTPLRFEVKLTRRSPLTLFRRAHNTKIILMHYTFMNEPPHHVIVWTSAHTSASCRKAPPPRRVCLGTHSTQPIELAQCKKDCFEDSL